jgi:hypothetical protein
MIKSRSEIVDGIANNQTENGVDGSDILDRIVGEHGFRVILTPKFARVCIEKDISPHIRITDVVIGPVDL